MDVLRCLGIELPQWLCSAMLALSHLLSFARKLLSRDHLRQIYIEQPRLLACELRQDITQRLTARVQGLGQPGPHLRPFQFMGDEGRVAQDTAEVLPHESVSDLRGGIARRAALAEGEPPRIRTAPTEVILVAGMHGATAAREPTLATADQSAQYIRIGRLVSTGHLHVTIQAVLSRFEGLLAEDGRHRHGHPLLRWGRLLTLAGPHRLQGRCATARRRGAGPATLGDARGGRRAQHAPYRGHVPTFATPGRGNLGLTEALGNLRQAWSLAGVGRPGKHVLHHGGLDRGNAHPAGITRAFGIEKRAVGGSGPGQQLATAELGLATSSPTLGDQGTLVLSHSAANL